MKPLVSIITPIYNSQEYLEDAIQSVLYQTLEDWELLLIDDGSSDDSLKIAKSYANEKIRVFQQNNRGVSSARNVGLVHMKGEFFCFLDSDDLLSKDSLKSRAEYLKTNPQYNFVDGWVSSFKGSAGNINSCWKPRFKGSPLLELLMLKDSCFFGITWMIRKSQKEGFRFDESLSFGEDLWFFIQQSKNGGLYTYVDQPIYLRRLTLGSAMGNIQKLVSGYHELFDRIVNLNLLTNDQVGRLKYKVKSIIVKSALAHKRFILAFNELLA